MRNKNEENRVAQKGCSLRSSAGFAASNPRKVLSASRLHKAIASVILSGLLPSLAFAGPSDQSDLTQLPFEQLLNTNIITATKLAKQVSEATSAVSIVTADDIRAYGYRTLDDILNSMRGLMTTQSAADAYSFLSGRGFGTPYDYPGRITLLIDGQRVSDAVYGQSFFGTEGFLDVELIDRVEYIPGAGSAIYGNGAFLGVINVITKKGSDFDGAQLGQETGSNHWNKTRLTYGKKFENGLDLLTSASSYSNGGRKAIRTNDGSEDKFNQEQNHRLFVKASFEGWGIESAWVRRPAYMPNGDLGQSDESTFLSTSYDTHIGSNLRFSGRASFGEYLNDNFWNNGQGYATYVARGRWNGVDAKFVDTRFDSHTVVLGVEYRHDYQQRFVTEDASQAPVPTYNGHSYSKAFYVYDEYEISSDLQLNYGLRYDNAIHKTVSPRIGVIYKPQSSTVLKLSSGEAYRQPAASERFGFQLQGMTTPRPEHVMLNELVWEEQLAPRTRLVSSVYYYRTNDRPFFDPSSPYGKVFSHGADVEFEHSWENGRRLKASYAWQDSKNHNGLWMTSSPHRLAKINVTEPILGERLRVGVEVQAASRRLELTDPEVEQGGYAVTNLTFTSSNFAPGWNASLSVRNLFNRSYTDLITSDGRNFWLQLSHDFK